MNPNLLNLDLKEDDSVSNASIALTGIYNLLLLNKQIYHVCSQLNEAQHHLFNFIMQYALYFKITKKNNELLLKQF